MTQIIELSEKSIQILDKQQLTDRNVLIISVDTGNMPQHKATEYLNNIKNAITNLVEPAHVIVTSKSTSISIDILEKNIDN